MPLMDTKTCKVVLALIVLENKHYIRIYLVPNVHAFVFLSPVLELLMWIEFINGIFQSILFTIVLRNIILNIMP